MANGGDALGRDENNRVIFVPYTIPGETARVRIAEDKGRFAHGRALEILEAAPERAEPRCPHFGVCGACHWQHIDYEAQLQYKGEIVRDQLERIGRLKGIDVRPTLPNPQPWSYGVEATFSPTPDGSALGFWSPSLERVMPIEICYIIRPILVDLLHDIDFDFGDLRSVTLRVGDDEALLVALELENMEPPELSTDVPLSIAVVLPGGGTANLVGDNYVLQAVGGRDFRVSASSFFYPSPAMAALLVERVLKYADLTGSELVLEGYSGVGMLTTFLAQQAAEVIAIESAPAAIDDAEVNLEEADNIILYAATVEEVLPQLTVRPDLMIVDPPAGGLSRDVVEMIGAGQPARLIYVSSDVATLARDGRQLHEEGYRLVQVQPLDMMPQTFHVHTVSLWEQ